MKRWRYNSLELCWYQGGDGAYADLKGLVWSIKPIYYAASVTVKDSVAIISEYGCHGLSETERASLLDYLNKLYPNSGGT